MDANFDKPSFDFSPLDPPLQQLVGHELALCLHDDAKRAETNFGVRTGRDNWDIFRMFASSEYYDTKMLKAPLDYGGETCHAVIVCMNKKIYIVK